MKYKKIRLTGHNSIINISATNGQPASIWWIFAHIVLLNPLINQIVRKGITGWLPDNITICFFNLNFIICLISYFKLSWAASQGSIFDSLISNVFLKNIVRKNLKSKLLERKRNLILRCKAKHNTVLLIRIIWRPH